MNTKAVLYTDAIGRELNLSGSGTEFNPEEYKPVSRLLLRWRCGGEFKNWACKELISTNAKKGKETWELISRATRSPYVFQPKLEETTKPEQWEFRAYGVIKDDEIGQPSNILELLLGN
ncbi:MAG: hypothetical protein R2805_06405 [Flavobacterium sp.]|uniref:hypothetical protein n=1 Tax=Flavobacterium sp. TaxID=239 RepID=UPI003527456A